MTTPQDPPPRDASNPVDPSAAESLPPSDTPETMLGKRPSNSGLVLTSFVTPLGLLLAVLIVFGLYLRVHDFGYPSSLQFDEHHFVETARGYLRHQSDWNDHPPLGKLLIAAGIQGFGDNSVGFRMPALIAGLLTVLLGAAAAQRLFRTKWAGTIAAALLSADGFLIAYSRAALLDGFLAMASAAALLLATYDVTLLWGCIAGVVFGLAVGVKFSGLGVLLPILFAIGLAPSPARTRWAALSAVVLVGGLMYTATYAAGLAITGKAHDLFAVIDDTERLLKHHAELTDMKNPSTSGWITWLLPTKPILLGIFEKHGSTRAMTTLGNLATWWGTMLVTLLSAETIVRYGWVRVLGKQAINDEDSVGAFVLGHGKSVLTVLLGALGFLAPWVLTHRDSYIYHFLPVYVPLVVLLSGLLAWYEPRRSRRILAFFVLATLIAAFYAPLWSYVPITRDAMNLRLFVPSWR